MNAAQLIEVLKQFDQQLEVVITTEYGFVNIVDVEQDGYVIIIETD